MDLCNKERWKIIAFLAFDCVFSLMQQICVKSRECNIDFIYFEIFFR